MQSRGNDNHMPQTDPSCYHCGLPIPAGLDLSVEIGGQRREMCCAGCQAVAQAIVANGLADYYRHRDAMPESPREALPQIVADFVLFDHPDVQKNFVRRAEGAAGEHEQEAALILEGITCAACVWLNESHVRRQPGVTSIDINYTTRRARVRWDERVTKLSAILEAIAAIGYRAHPYDVGRSEELAQKERKAALWRLFVAGFGMMQVMMYAVPVYLADGDMTPDIEQLMRWASLILTVPVIGYSAAPFFVSAWRDLKLHRVGMDVPVALGVGAAFAASVWATLIAGGRSVFRLGHHVRLLPAFRALPGNDGAAEGGAQRRNPGPRHTRFCYAPGVMAGGRQHGCGRRAGRRGGVARRRRGADQARRNRAGRRLRARWRKRRR
jgi:Cu2+-exporting ATPase